MALFPSRAFRTPRDRVSGFIFAFGVDDLSVAVPTGQALTFARASGRTILDAGGRIGTLVHSQLPWAAQWNADAATWEPVYDPQSGTTNLFLRSEDFGTTWSTIGSPTRTAAAKRCGDLVLDLLGDDAGGTLEGYSQVASFTGNAVKALSVFIAQATSTSSVLRLRDTSAGANRLLATITWNAGVPAVAMTTGSHVGTIACADGVYRLLFQATSVTAANTNQLEVYPATTSGLATGNTGTLYIGGVQAENAANPRSYVKTLGSTVTTATDVLTTQVTLPLTDFTVFARLARPTWAGATGGASPPIITGPQTSANNGKGVFHVYYNPVASMSVVAEVADLSTSAGASATLPGTAMLDICAQFRNLRTGAQVRLDVGGGFGSWSSAGPVLTGWDSPNVGLGVIPGLTTVAADSGIRRALMAPGLRALAELAGAPV